MIMHEDKHCLSVQEAADYLRISATFLRHGLRRGWLFRICGTTQPPPAFDYDYTGELCVAIDELRSYALLYADYFDGLKGTAADTSCSVIRPTATAKERKAIDQYRKQRLAVPAAAITPRKLYHAAHEKLTRLIGKKPGLAGMYALPYLPPNVEMTLRGICQQLGAVLSRDRRPDVGYLSTRDTALYLGIGQPYLRMMRIALRMPTWYTTRPPVQIQMAVPLVRELRRMVFRDTAGIRPSLDPMALTLTDDEATQLERLRRITGKTPAKPRRERISPAVHATFKKTLRAWRKKPVEK